jgi:hypothetical protein
VEIVKFTDVSEELAVSIFGVYTVKKGLKFSFVLDAGIKESTGTIVANVREIQYVC